jgi:hypothetical protein
MSLRFRLLLSLACAVTAYAQAPTAPKPDPDTLILIDGERLIGHFVRSTGGNVVFKSDVLGDLIIGWAKVKELHTAQRYVVVGKDVKLTRHTDISGLPKGTVSADAQTVTVEPAPGAPPQKIPVANAAFVVDEPTFQHVLFHSPSFFEDWKGSVTGGASIVEATQQSRMFTGGIALIRAVPLEDWLSARNRTIVGFTVSDGFVTQPNTPRVKTDIYHAGIERDEYFRGKDLYGFVQATFDHNYSQGLDLQTNVGGGLGYTVINRANETLDFKGSVTYIRQNFQTELNNADNTSLLGSNFIETYTRKSAHGILFLQQVTVTPTWTVLEDWSASASGSVSIPVFKRLGFTFAVADNLLNNPPPGFKKNSFQLTTGLTYTLR